jgi:hypothetical protein
VGGTVVVTGAGTVVVGAGGAVVVVVEVLRGCVVDVVDVDAAASEEVVALDPP